MFLDAKSDALDVWGQGSESLKPAIADTEKPEPQMRGGGGALQRAFISEYGSEFKTPEGKISFSEANAAYAIEVAKPASEKLDHIRTKGKRATLACRENFQKFGKPRAGTLSSFGTVKHTELKKEEERRDVHLMLTDMELAQASRPVESSLQIAALRSQQNAVFDLVQDRYPGDIPKQVAMIRRTSRLHACQQKKAEREEDRALTEAISRPVEIQGVDMSGIGLPVTGALKLLPGKGLDSMVLSDHCVDSAAAQAASLRKERKKSAPKVLEAFKSKHKLILQSSQPKLNLSEGFKPSICFKLGHGLCLCSGRGLLLKEMRASFCRVVTRLCPPRSTMRHWLEDGWLVAALPEDGLFMHIAVFYLRPYRPTFVELVDAGDARWGKLKLDVVYEANGAMKVWLDTLLFNSLNFDTAKSLQLLKLCSLKRMVGSFAPGSNVLADLIEGKHLSRHGDSGSFWRGSSVEVQKLKEKEARKRELEAARRSRLKSGEQPEKRLRRPQRGAPKDKADRAMRRPPRVPGQLDLLAISDGIPDDESAGEQFASDSDNDLFADESEPKGFSEAVQNDMLMATFFDESVPDALQPPESGDDIVSDLFSDESHHEEGPSHSEPVPGLVPEQPVPGLVPDAVAADAGGDAPLEYSYSPTEPGDDAPSEHGSSTNPADSDGPGAGSQSDRSLVYSPSDAGAAVAPAAPENPDDSGDSSTSSSSSKGSSGGDSSSEEQPDRILCLFGAFRVRKLFQGDEYAGVKIDCRRHRNDLGTPRCELKCGRSIFFGVHNSVSEHDAILRAKRWALWGYTIDQALADARDQHHRRAPRSFSSPLPPAVWAVVPDVFLDGSLDGL